MPAINSTGWLIIIIFVAFIIIINIWLLFNSRNNNSKSGILILRNAFKDPFQDENNKLEELSKLTAKFKEMEQKKSEEDSGEKNAK